MDTNPWQRVADYLQTRRSELRSEWIDRTTFARDSGLSYRTLSDLENARRDNYKPAWIHRVEKEYQLQRGSIAALLRGGDATPASEPAREEPSRPVGVERFERTWSEASGRWRCSLSRMHNGQPEEVSSTQPPEFSEEQCRKAMEQLFDQMVVNRRHI